MINLVLNKTKTLIFLVLLFSCSFNNNNKNDFLDNENVINKEGVYSIMNNYKINVINEKQLIDFIIYDNKNNLLYHSNKKFSNYHKWFFIINDNIIWLYSGDIGTYAWRIKKNKIIEIDIDSILQNKKGLPKEIEDKL